MKTIKAGGEHKVVRPAVVVDTPVNKGTTESARTAPPSAPVPSAKWAPSAAENLKQALAGWNGSFTDAVKLVGDAVWLKPQVLLGMVLDAHEGDRHLDEQARTLLGDVLVARAPELDASAWKQILGGLRKELSNKLSNKTGAVAEDLVEALTAMTPFLDANQRLGLKKEIARLPAGEPSVAQRLGVLTSWIDAAGPGSRPPTKPLATELSVPLSASEKAELRSVVAVADEATVNAKIPADLALAAKDFTFERDFYSKGWLGGGVPGVLVCDTGNALEPGVTDHHQLGERTCAAALVLNRAELIVEQHQRQPIEKLICHSSPDLDAVSSVFLAELILRDGKVPDGATRLATYVSLEDNARMPVGDGDPTKNLATLCREAVLQLAKQRHPAPQKDPGPIIQRARDEEVLFAVKGILEYVLASGKDPADESLFALSDASGDKKDPAMLPAKTRADIEALQGIVAAAETEANGLVKDVKFGDGRLPRIDGKAALDVHLALTPTGGKRLDSILRERERADVVIIATPEYTWTAAEPTSGASLRPIAASYEALERQKARAEGVDRQPGADERLQPGWSVKNPYYIGGTDTFVVTPRAATLTTEERLDALTATAGVRWSKS